MTVKIKAYENGPIVIEGALTVENGNGPAPAQSAALCRCGQSGKGLYCDGTHAQVGFHAEGFDLSAVPTSPVGRSEEA